MLRGTGVAGTAAITGGTIDGAVIGGTTPAAGTFTVVNGATGSALLVKAATGQSLQLGNADGIALLVGSGTVQFKASASFSANGSVATVLGSVGPAGSHTSVQKWLTILDNTGATLYVPAF
jgi:hypothetical protein